MIPFELTVRLQQGVALDSRFGTALDGLLTSQSRAAAKAEAGGEGPPLSGRDLDGGLDNHNPTDCDLPLARCPGDGTPNGWHWLATFGIPIGPDSRKVTAVESHHWTGRIDQRQMAAVAVSLPGHVPEHNGRYRTRRMPTVVTFCSALKWRGTGDPAAVFALINDLPSVGSGRNRGEGAVLAWEITEHPDGNQDVYGHVDRDGRLARPCPTVCAERLKVAYEIGPAGIRPPYFHRNRQAMLAVPV